MKRYSRKTKQKRKGNKQINYAGWSITFLLIGLVGAGFGTGILKGGFGGITTGYTGSGEAESVIARVIPLQKEEIGNSLFDVIVTIPEKSKRLKSDENLLVSIELINFGDSAKTDTTISYIITNDQGDVVFIEHEERIVETQMSFIKEIDLSGVGHGYYNLFVELLYSNTSATATEEFRISYVN